MKEFIYPFFLQLFIIFELMRSNFALTVLQKCIDILILVDDDVYGQSEDRVSARASSSYIDPVLDRR